VCAARRRREENQKARARSLPTWMKKRGIRKRGRRVPEKNRERLAGSRCFRAQTAPLREKNGPIVTNIKRRGQERFQLAVAERLFPSGKRGGPGSGGTPVETSIWKTSHTFLGFGAGTVKGGGGTFLTAQLNHKRGSTDSRKPTERGRQTNPPNGKEKEATATSGKRGGSKSVNLMASRTW